MWPFRELSWAPLCTKGLRATRDTWHLRWLAWEPLPTDQRCLRARPRGVGTGGQGAATRVLPPGEHGCRTVKGNVEATAAPFPIPEAVAMAPRGRTRCRILRVPVKSAEPARSCLKRVTQLISCARNIVRLPPRAGSRASCQRRSTALTRPAFSTAPSPPPLPTAHPPSPAVDLPVPFHGREITQSVVSCPPSPA